MQDPAVHPRQTPERLARLEALLGYTFRDQGRLRKALCHTSTRQLGMASNERLEFLGDSVLGFMVSMHLFEAHPGMAEGELSKRRARAVSRPALVQAAQALELQDYLVTGRGLERKQALPEKVLADAMEALVGAVFDDGGVDAAWGVVALHFLPFSRSEPGAGPLGENHKDRLQRHLSSLGAGHAARYGVVHTEGPPHDRVFLVAVSIGQRSFGPGRGRSKKEAEQEAARMALDLLKKEAGDGLAAQAGDDPGA